MANETPVRQLDPLEKLITDLQVLALEYPHTAVTSENRQFKSTFYNVYFKSEVESYLSKVEIHPDYAYLAIGRLVAQGYTVKLIPRNKLGYCQCTITQPSGEDGGQAGVVTGEAGKMFMAVISAFAKIILITRDAGEGEVYWAGRKQNAIESGGFR